LFVNGE